MKTKKRGRPPRKLDLRKKEDRRIAERQLARKRLEVGGTR